MALTSGGLAAQLESAFILLTGPSNPNAAGEVSNAWAAYFKTATLSGFVPVPAAVDAGALAFKAALGFVSDATPAAGAAGWQAAVAAFWAHLQSVPLTYWPGFTGAGVSPAGIVSIGAGLVTQFGVNIAPSTTTAQAATNIAGVLHSLGGIGGTVTVLGTPTPIL